MASEVSVTSWRDVTLVKRGGYAEAESHRVAIAEFQLVPPRVCQRRFIRDLQQYVGCPSIQPVKRARL